MKVLHLSEYGLPDWRIEKSAITAKREGYEVFFAGEKNSPHYRNIIFEKIYEFHWNLTVKNKLPFYYQTLKNINNFLANLNLRLFMHTIFFQQN